jgi:hypothetical protein
MEMMHPVLADLLPEESVRTGRARIGKDVRVDRPVHVVEIVVLTVRVANRGEEVIHQTADAGLVRPLP